MRKQRVLISISVAMASLILAIIASAIEPSANAMGNSGNTVSSATLAGNNPKSTAVGNSITAAFQATAEDTKAAKAELKKAILKTIEKQPDKAMESVREFLRYADAEDIVFLIKLVNKYQKKPVAGKIKKEIMRFRSWEFYKTLERVAQESSLDVGKTIIEMYLEINNYETAIEMLLPHISRENLINKWVIDIFENANNVTNWQALGYKFDALSKDDKLPVKTRVMMILLAYNYFYGSFDFGLDRYRVVLNELMESDNEYYQKAMDFIETAAIKKGHTHGWPLEMVREIIKSENSAKTRRAREIFDKIKAITHEVDYRDLPPDNTEGLFYSNNNGKMELLKSLRIRGDEMLKHSNEELQKNIKNDDYMMRMLAVQVLEYRLAEAGHKEEIEIYNPGEKNWEEYVEKMMIDLKHSYERNYYYNIESQFIDMYLIKLHPVAVPMLARKVQNKNLSDNYRKGIISTLLCIGAAKKESRQEILAAYKLLLQDPNTGIVEASKAAMLRLEEYK